MIHVIKSAAKKMLIDFEDTRIITHNLTKGRAREYIVLENFLRPYLPQRFSVGSGLIIDSQNNSSRQQDLMIYDNFYTPVLMDLDADKILFPEAVFAAIEVKSRLTGDELKDTAKKSISVWQLTKSFAPNIVLSPTLVIPTVDTQILCLGICFNSDLSLEDTVERLRAIRAETKEAYALSVICILSDKNDQAGLIVNNAADNLENIALIPDINSRLGVIRCETPGDALLYTYLLLMEHLRNCGTTVPGPNLMAYAKNAGLGVAERRISPTEMAGAYVSMSGMIVSTDIAKRVSELTPRVLNDVASAEEIIEWFYLLPHLPSGEVILNPRAVFTENRRPLQVPTPRAVYEAITRLRENKPLDQDKTVLEEFVKFIHSIKLEGRSFGIEEI